MPQRNSRKAVRFLKDADDIMFLLTGTRMKQVAGRAATLFGQDLAKKVFTQEPAPPAFDPDDPYYILGCRQDASDLVVKACFRSLSRVYHSDTGDHPNRIEFQRVQEAYKKIMTERNAKEDL